MGVGPKKRVPGKGSSASLAGTIVDYMRLWRTFGGNRLAASPDQSECPEPNGEPPKTAPQTWLEQHLESMADDFADLIADRLKAPPPTKGGHSLLLTKAQVAAELQCSTKSVDRWCEEGLLPEPFYLGSSRRWMRKDLEAWFQKREWQG